MITLFEEEQNAPQDPKQPPFPDDTWCKWCAGTGHPYGDESKGICKCPEHRKENQK
jgi:hypothetical protein